MKNQMIDAMFADVMFSRELLRTSDMPSISAPGADLLVTAARDERRRAIAGYRFAPTATAWSGLGVCPAPGGSNVKATKRPSGITKRFFAPTIHRGSRPLRVST